MPLSRGWLRIDSATRLRSPAPISCHKAHGWKYRLQMDMDNGRTACQLMRG